MKEGRLTNHHYEHFFTDYFKLDKEFYTGKKVMDIGCGPRGSLEWADNAEERVGLDPLVNDYLKLGAKDHKMSYAHAYSEDIPFPDNHFDVVTSFNSLDHVNDLDKTVAEITRVVKPGGLFLFICDMHEDPKLCEPVAITSDIIKTFDAFEVVSKEFIKDEKKGIYVNLRNSERFESEDLVKEGVITVKFRKK